MILIININCFDSSFNIIKIILILEFFSLIKKFSNLSLLFYWNEKKKDFLLLEKKYINSLLIKQLVFLYKCNIEGSFIYSIKINSF